MSLRPARLNTSMLLLMVHPTLRLRRHPPIPASKPLTSIKPSLALLLPLLLLMLLLLMLLLLMRMNTSPSLPLPQPTNRTPNTRLLPNTPTSIRLIRILRRPPSSPSQPLHTTPRTLSTSQTHESLNPLLLPSPNTPIKLFRIPIPLNTPYNTLSMSLMSRQPMIPNLLIRIPRMLMLMLMLLTIQPRCISSLLNTNTTRARFPNASSYSNTSYSDSGNTNSRNAYTDSDTRYTDAWILRSRWSLEPSNRILNIPLWNRSRKPRIIR